MNKKNEPKVSALAQRIQNRATRRIAKLLADAREEPQSKELWSKLWGAMSDGLVAAVDPSDLKSVWRMGRERQAEAQAVGATGHAIGLSAYKSMCTPGADVIAIWYRVSMLSLCDNMGLLAGYKRNGELMDAVFQVAAAFPMKRMEIGVEYQGPPFDAEEFVKLVERASAG